MTYKEVIDKIDSAITATQVLDNDSESIYQLIEIRGDLRHAKIKLEALATRQQSIGDEED